MAAPKNEHASWLSLAEKYYVEGKQLYEQDKYDAALVPLKKAEDIYLQLGKTRDLKLADVYYIIGVCYFYKWNLQKGIEATKKAFSIQLEKLGPAKEKTLDTCFNLIGFYTQMGEYEKALTWLHKIEELHPKLIHTISYQSSYLHILWGVFYTKQEDNGRAIPYFQKALQVAELLEDPKEFIPICYNQLANCYHSIQQWEKAIETYHKAVDYNIAHNKEISGRTAGTYYHLGFMYHQIGKYEQSIFYYHKALDIQNVLFEEDCDAIAFTYLGLGQTYTKLKQFDKAEKYFQSALQIVLKIDRKHNITLIELYQHLLVLYFYKKDYFQALQNGQRALHLLTTTCSRTDIYDLTGVEKNRKTMAVKLLAYRAKAFYGCYQKEKQAKYLQCALENAELSIQVLEAIRKEYRSNDSKLPLLQKYIYGYQAGMEITHTIWEITGQITALEKAFVFLEKAKASLLLASMQEGIAKATTVIPPHLLQQETVLKKQLGQLEQALQQKEMDRANNEAAIRDLQAEYLDNQKAYIRLMEQLERDYPDYYQLKYETQTASIHQIQALLQPKEVLIEYGLFENLLFIFTIDAKEISFKKIPYSTDVQQMVTDFQQTIFLSDLEEFCRIGGALYELLLTPIEEACKGKNKLFIISDGILQHLPFEALISPANLNEAEPEGFSDLPYLLQSFDIQYHYSATLLGYAHQKEQKAQKESLKDNFLGLAPIKFNTTTASNSGYMLKSGKKGRELILKSGGNEEEALMDLEETEAEIKMIYQLFEKQQKEAIALFYDMASKENLLAHIEQYKYILLSTHGFSNTEYTALSGLNLYAADSNANTDSPTDSNKPSNDEKGKLYISDVMNLQLKADLVVLSSCESGIGKLQAGEGMMALHRAFLYAGAQNIVYSLFKVPQDSTSELVQSFFRYALEGDTYSTALRKAKLELINDASFEPVDWAGFALIGG